MAGIYRNKLLEFPETRSISELYMGNKDDEGIYNPFTEMDPYILEKKKGENKQLLIILDDLQEVVYRSPVVSQIFSKGRHVNVSCLLLLQT